MKTKIQDFISNLINYIFNLNVTDAITSKLTTRCSWFKFHANIIFLLLTQKLFMNQNFFTF